MTQTLLAPMAAARSEFNQISLMPGGQTGKVLEKVHLSHPFDLVRRRALGEGAA
jgi:hypothetical protein